MLGDAAVGEFVNLIGQSVEEIAVVGDDDQRAVESHQRLFENLLGLQVEVVGRLVEDQQVDRFEQQLDHRQARPLTAGEHLDELLAGLLAEHEGTQDVADTGPDVAHGDVVDGLEDGDRLVESRRLVLREVADPDVVADPDLTLEVDLPHDGLDHRRLALAVASHESHLVAAPDGDRHAAEHPVAAVRLAQFGGDDRIGTRTRSGRKAQVQRRGVLLVHLDEFQFFEHPHARLHLVGLRIGPLETLDELAGLGDHLLLVVVGRLLLLAPFAPQAEVARVVDFVVVDTPAGDLDGARGDMVYEGLVVGNDHHGLGVVHQKILQPLDRLDVEVVRRLVQQQQVGFLQQQLGQLDAHAPAAREFGGLAREVAPFEAQPQQNALHVFLIVGEVHGIELLGDGRDLLDQPHVRLAFVVGAGRELLVERRDPPLDFEQVFECP